MARRDLVGFAGCPGAAGAQRLLKEKQIRPQTKDLTLLGGGPWSSKYVEFPRGEKH